MALLNRRCQHPLHDAESIRRDAAEQWPRLPYPGHVRLAVADVRSPRPARPWRTSLPTLSGKCSAQPLLPGLGRSLKAG
jgi:hypothetical protein